MNTSDTKIQAALKFTQETIDAHRLIKMAEERRKQMADTPAFIVTTTETPVGTSNKCKCGNDAPKSKTECLACYRKRMAKIGQAKAAAKPRPEKRVYQQPSRKSVITEAVAVAAVARETKECLGCKGPIGVLGSDLCPVCLSQKRADEQIAFIAAKKGVPVEEYKKFVAERAANRPEEERRPRRRRG